MNPKHYQVDKWLIAWLVILILATTIGTANAIAVGEVSGMAAGIRVAITGTLALIVGLIIIVVPWGLAARSSSRREEIKQDREGVLMRLNKWRVAALVILGLSAVTTLLGARSLEDAWFGFYWLVFWTAVVCLCVWIGTWAVHFVREDQARKPRERRRENGQRKAA